MPRPPRDRPLRTTLRSARRLGAPLLARRHLLPPAVDSLLERVRWSGPRSTVAAGEAPTGPGALVIAPANFAGQGWAWARAYEQATGSRAAAWAYRTDGVFRFPADWSPSMEGVARLSGATQRHRFEDVARVSAVVLEAGRPLFGGLFGFDPVREVRALRARGVRVALLWHGTDIRLPSEHARTHPLSPFGSTIPPAQAARLESTAHRNRSRAARAGVPQIVSTPDLLESVPGATWCPVVVDVDAWAVGAVPVLERARPVVVHLPSNEAVKGSDLVRAALRDLDREGLIELREATRLPADEVRSLYRHADVVLDQFRLGIYGVAACEAMAAGRVVLSDVDATVRRRVRAETGLELPVVQTSAAQVRERLVEVLADRRRYRERAADGAAFVRAVHDGRRSAAVLRALVGSAAAGDR